MGGVGKIKAAFTKIEKQKLLRSLGLEEMGKVQKHWINDIVIPKMIPYLPKLAAGQPETALKMGGAAAEKGIVTVKGPQMKYLFYGKVMAGKPKKPIDKDLVYTTTHHKLAGPSWDTRLKEDKMEEMEDELFFYIKEIKK